LHALTARKEEGLKSLFFENWKKGKSFAGLRGG